MSEATDRPDQSAPPDADQRPAQTVEAFGTVESNVPGRVRVRLKPELRTPQAMAKIQEQLNSHEHVGEASINPRTGSVLFTHAKHRRGEEIFLEALKETELVAATVMDLPDDGEEEGGGGYAKLDQQLADLLNKVDYEIWRKTGLNFRGQILAGTIAVAGVAQIAVFGISLEMLPGPILLWIAWDIYHRMSKEPSFEEQAGAVTIPVDEPESQGEAAVSPT